MKSIKVIIIFVILIYFNTGCQHETDTVKSTYLFIEPTYNQVKVESTTDTLHFLLNDNSYNDIKSFNLFEKDSQDYLSFFDERSASLIIYHLQGCEMVTKIPLERFFKNHSLYKTSVYVRNYDSILITNRATMYLFDSSGHKICSTPFLNNPPDALALLGNDNAPVLVGEELYTIVRPSIFNEYIGAYKKWKVLYKFNLKKDSVQLQYNLPSMYHKNLYGYQYLYSSFCYNNKNRFVFSFAADSNIYETDLSAYHIAYYGKSRYQDEPPKWKNGGKEKDEEFRNYLTHQAYGTIYFDSYKHYYLRVAKKKISNEEFEAKNWSREQSLIIFDETMKVIGESNIDKNIDLKEVFFTKKGDMYARTNRSDEYALNFVRLRYQTVNTPIKIVSK